MSDKYQTMTEARVYGPTWTADDPAEAVALAEEHGYEVLDVVNDRDDVNLLVVKA